jgi:hypothetical protein
VLIAAEEYLLKIDESPIASGADEVANIALRLNKAAVYARTYFVIGKMEEARNLQSYATRLIERVDELAGTGAPISALNEIPLYKKLLNF